MVSCALKDFKCTTWRQRTAWREAHFKKSICLLKSFNIRLTVDYPAYFMVISVYDFEVGRMLELIFISVYYMCVCVCVCVCACASDACWLVCIN